MMLVSGILMITERARDRRHVAVSSSLPMTSAATPVSAAAKQQHQNNHNKDHFHGKSP
jgi:hypothetical protein